MKDRNSMKYKPLIVLFAVVTSWQGCTYETLPSPVDCEAEGVVIDNVSVQGTDCGLSTGRIEVTASRGATGVYQYKLDDGPYQTSNVFDNISVGSFVVTVKDGSCTDSEQVVIKNKNGVNILITSTTNAGCGTNVGSILIDGQGGTPPYQYKINNGAYQSNKAFTGLASGEYNMHVKDATNCEAWQKVQVTSGISYSAHIESIMNTYCAVSGCHNGTIGLPNFTEFSTVKSYAALIKARTQDKTMPKGSTMPQEKIDQIACWVDDGASHE